MDRGYKKSLCSLLSFAAKQSPPIILPIMILPKLSLPIRCFSFIRC